MNILTVANAVPRKRLDLCARACKYLEDQNRYPDLKWRVISRGPLLDQVKALAPSSMEFLDRVDFLPDYYRWCDIFVLPSSEEGFGMVYIESVICGAPVVCRAGDGGQDILDGTGGGVGVDVPDDDGRAVANIVEAIDRIAANRDQFITDEIVQKAKDMVDPHRLRQQWEDLIRSCGFDPDKPI